MLDEKNMRGQVGETMTWMVGTIVIIVILLVSIFIVSVLGGKEREIGGEGEGERILGKSLLGYFGTEDKNSGELIYTQLEKEGAFNPSTGKLAQDVFEGIYHNTGLYSGVWAGFFEGWFQPYESNDYFERRISTNRDGKSIFHTNLKYISESVNINKEKGMEVRLIEKVK